MKSSSHYTVIYSICSKFQTLAKLQAEKLAQILCAKNCSSFFLSNPSSFTYFLGWVHKNHEPLSTDLFVQRQPNLESSTLMCFLGHESTPISWHWSLYTHSHKTLYCEKTDWASRKISDTEKEKYESDWAKMKWPPLVYTHSHSLVIFPPMQIYLSAYMQF